MDLGLAGKRVIVTGGSKGIGKAIARTFLDEGARVMICARDETVLAETVGELTAHGEIHHRRADMAVPEDITGLVDAAVETFGGIDVLVSNVSGFGGRDYQRTCDVDILGTELLMRSALEHMEDHADASIVCIGSRAGSVGVAWMPAYAAAKAATVSMTTSLAQEVARRGIRVNTVSPGDVKFPGGTWERVETENPKLHEAILRENPFRRFGRPEEIADVVAFVASPRASFVSGTNVLVDGAATRHLQL